MVAQKQAPGAVLAEGPGESWRLQLAGTWSLHRPSPSPQEAQAALRRGSAVRTLEFDCSQLGDWDTSLAVYLQALRATARQLKIRWDPSGLPAGLQRLLELAAGASSSAAPAGDHLPPGFLARLGAAVARHLRWNRDALAFLGGLARALPRLLSGRARWRRADLGLFVQQGGPGALPIVSLIALLVGLILAFIGAVQLQTFGVQIYVANLVGIGMARDMGAMMTAVIMAGRTGAAYAAQLGTMQVNEEIDALRTLGIDPLEFLVLPRVLALVLMMPLLCCYADLMGILGGGLACISLFDITPLQYLQQTWSAVPLHHFAGGLVKAAVYGLVVGLAGCHRGLACGGSAEAVGEATTAAVVTGIVWVVVWCAILTVLYNQLGI